MNFLRTAMPATSKFPAPHCAGQLCTLEGVDGAGKSSHTTAIVEYLRDQGREVVQTREPGGTDLAERLRELVLKEPMDALTESLLVFAARRDHLQRVIEPALQRGAVVLCDRFTDSSFAYQGGGRGFDLDVLRQLERWVQVGRQPDLTLWFDLPGEEAAKRRSAARAPDRFEAEDVAFFNAVRAGYAARAEAEPHRFVRIDASGSLPEVRASVMRVIEERVSPPEAARRSRLRP